MYKGQEYMRTIIIGMSVATLVAASGWAETIITAQDYAVDSDVVLESVVKEVKSLPRDTVNVIGDVIKYAKDETVTAAEGVASVFKKDAHAKAQKDGELAVEDAWDSNNNIHFRSYKISDDLMGELIQVYAADKSAPAIDVADFFKSVEFPEKTSIRYLPEFKSLFVRQTMPNLLAIEDVLASYQSEQKDLLAKQVEIEAKFIEVSQKTMNELGFDWTFESRNGGDLKLFGGLSLPAPQDILTAGLRNASSVLLGAPVAGTLDVVGNIGSTDFSLAINALEQSDDSDVLSAPRVVTHSHEEAVIQVGEYQWLPKELTIENNETSPYVQHDGWEETLTGVKMTVTPEVRHDGLIDLEINAEILDLIGYDSYTFTAPLATTDDPTTPLIGTLPYFRVRSLDTRATLSDGSTIAMGGLIYDKLETFRDKVPVLGSIPWVGRLFRSEGERSVKRNLMIFVTATQVDVHGRRSADLVLQK